MAIYWDENQLPALSSLISEKVPFTNGKMSVATMDTPPNTFAGAVDLPGKEFTVFASLDAPLADVTVNVFLGYIVALAYDRSGWSGMPTIETLVDCHREVCQAMLDFNEDFSRTLEEHAPILEVWHQTHVTDDATTEVDTGDLIEALGTSLFVANPADSKDYGSN